MAKVLVSPHLTEHEVIELIAKEKKLPQLLSKAVVDFLTKREDDEKEHLVLEKTRLGYLVVGIYGDCGNVLYEYKDTPGIEDVIFFDFLP